MSAIHNLLFGGRRLNEIEKLFKTGVDGGYYLVKPQYCFQDTSATTPCVAGDPVGYLQDLSGRGRHLLQSSSTLRPTLNVDGNGQYYLQFDGVDDRLASNNFDLVCTVPFLLIAGISKDDQASTTAFFCARASSTVFHNVRNSSTGQKVTGAVRNATDNVSVNNSLNSMVTGTLTTVSSAQETNILDIRSDLGSALTTATTTLGNGDTLTSAAHLGMQSISGLACAAGKYYGALYVSNFNTSLRDSLIKALASGYGVSL